jgi:hypothetical protein
MTRDEILNMPAGRKMNDLIHEKIIGAIRKQVDGLRDYWWEGRYQNGQPYWYQDAPSYSADIAAAWEVLEKMRCDCNGGGEPDYITLVCYKELEPTWYCAKIWAHHDGDIPEVEVTAETAPLAICRAALLAVMESQT